jgi:hypothetical protein
MALAPSPNRLAGVATMSIAGSLYMIAGGLEWRVSDYNVETLKGQDGIHGTKEMPEEGMIKAKLRDSGQISVAALSALRNAPVVVQTATGKIISGSNMWRSGDPPSVSTEDGTFDIEFSGADVTEAATL